jgi:hypothetical protein
MTTTIGSEQNRPQERRTRPSRRVTTARWRSQLRRLWKLSEAQAALGWAIITLLAAVVGTIYLVQASTVAETGRRVQLYQLELVDLKRQNNLIERQIAEAQALDRLQQDALRLGFVKADPEAITYIVVTDYPNTWLTPTPAPTPLPQPIDTIDEALFAVLQSQLLNLTKGEALE